MKKRISFVVNDVGVFFARRRAIVDELKKRGCTVTVIGPVNNDNTVYDNVNVIPINMSRSGLSLFGEAVSMYEIARGVLCVQPDVLHCFGLKSIIYGSISGVLFSNAKLVNSIIGLGYVFINDKLKHRFVRSIILLVLHLMAFSKRTVFTYENSSDMELLGISKGKSEDNHVVMPMGYVDTTEYAVRNKKSGSNNLQVCFVGRLVRDKGVIEYIQAAKDIRSKNSTIEFLLVGPIDSGSATEIDEAYIKSAHEDGCVKYLGETNNVMDVLKDVDIFCLPSYREGMSRVLMEAAAAGLPLVTTDVPGCSDICMSGYNGVLVKPRNVNSLVNGVQRLIFDDALRIEFGNNSRVLAVQKYDIKNTLQRILDLYQI